MHAHSGGRLATSSRSELLLPPSARENTIATMERRIVGLLLSGTALKAVAERINVPPRTVAYYAFKAMDANGVSTLTELAARRSSLPGKQISGKRSS